MYSIFDVDVEISEEIFVKRTHYPFLHFQLLFDLLRLTKLLRKAAQSVTGRLGGEVL